MSAFYILGEASVFLGSVMGTLIAASAGLLALAAVALLVGWLTLRWVPNSAVGVVEKLWSATGSVGEGHIIALNGEAGFQADLLRGGIHFGLWRWQYRVHKTPLVTIPQGRLGYVYARDGEALAPTQTLGQEVPCNHFQDVQAFLEGDDARVAARTRRDSGRGPRGTAAQVPRVRHRVRGCVDRQAGHGGEGRQDRAAAGAAPDAAAVI